MLTSSILLVIGGSLIVTAALLPQPKPVPIPVLVRDSRPGSIWGQPVRRPRGVL